MGAIINIINREKEEVLAKKRADNFPHSKR
jgi:hypothetical protein